jgi:hypothetical protein
MGRYGIGKQLLIGFVFVMLRFMRSCMQKAMSMMQLLLMASKSGFCMYPIPATAPNTINLKTPGSAAAARGAGKCTVRGLLQAGTYGETD